MNGLVTARAAGVALVVSACLLAPTWLGAQAPSPRPELITVTPAELAEVVRAQAGPVLVNVWATWCVPCREEFPDLLRIRERYAGAGLRLVLVSADFDRQVEGARSFLAAQGVDFVSYHKSGDDAEFIDALSPQWSGALPATFIFDARHRLVRWWEGKASLEQFDGAVRAVLGESAKGEPR